MPDKGTRHGPSSQIKIALTGATGFVGRTMLARLDAAGAPVTALARPQPGRDLSDSANLHWISGGLDQPDALDALVAGADVVIHCAGATKALNTKDFHRVNATATKALVRAARKAGVGHFILMSSLAATRPSVSDYAASKAAGEDMARAETGDMALTIVRAPAVIGPGDQATEPLFSMIARGWMPVVGGKARNARFSVIDVEDLSTLLIELAQTVGTPPRGQILAPYGHHSLGWPDLAASGARVTGRSIRQITLPMPLAILAGHGADLVARLTGQAQVFSSGKIREMRAGDWTGDTPLVTFTPLDVTMQRCLHPFLRLSNATNQVVRKNDRSPE
ncbi:MAG: SDR family NAD(P)-dependent oxidoreductase [Roseovarius sp.]|nr:SDR family NAD(P)-dependent oxidoreductase [Roseovarius sp.]